MSGRSDAVAISVHLADLRGVLSVNRHLRMVPPPATRWDHDESGEHHWHHPRTCQRFRRRRGYGTGEPDADAAPWAAFGDWRFLTAPCLRRPTRFADPKQLRHFPDHTSHVRALPCATRTETVRSTSVNPLPAGITGAHQLSTPLFTQDASGTPRAQSRWGTSQLNSVTGGQVSGASYSVGFEVCCPLVVWGSSRALIMVAACQCSNA